MKIGPLGPPPNDGPQEFYPSSFSETPHFLGDTNPVFQCLLDRSSLRKDPIVSLLGDSRHTRIRAEDYLRRSLLPLKNGEPVRGEAESLLSFENRRLRWIDFELCDLAIINGRRPLDARESCFIVAYRHLASPDVVGLIKNYSANEVVSPTFPCPTCNESVQVTNTFSFLYEWGPCARCKQREQREEQNREKKARMALEKQTLLQQEESREQEAYERSLIALVGRARVLRGRATYYSFLALIGLIIPAFILGFRPLPLLWGEILYLGIGVFGTYLMARTWLHLYRSWWRFPAYAGAVPIFMAAEIAFKDAYPPSEETQRFMDLFSLMYSVESFDDGTPRIVGACLPPVPTRPWWVYHKWCVVLPMVLPFISFVAGLIANIFL